MAKARINEIPAFLSGTRAYKRFTVSIAIGFLFLIVLSPVVIRSSLSVLHVLALLGCGISFLFSWIFFRQAALQAGAGISHLFEKNRLLEMTEKRANVGHWRLDFADNDLDWSDQTYKIYGLDPGAPITLDKAVAAFHEDDRMLVNNAIEGARLSGQPYTFNARLVRPSGEIRHTQAVAEIEKDKIGNPVAVFGIFADRTEEIQITEKMKGALEEARRADAAKGSFLARTSHEIRTPLNGIVGFADLLSSEDIENENHREYIRLILESGKNLTLLLNDILDLSKIEAGLLNISEEETDLPSLISRCAQIVEPAAREKGLDVRVQVSGGIPRNLMTDPFRLRQVVLNLLTNAVKFTPSGGVVIAAGVDNDRIVIAVKDTGIGISPENTELIFDAFSQSDEGVTRQYGGTGLGLAICKQLAGLLGGSISVKTAEGVGSEFVIDLPLIVGSSPQLRRHQKPTGSPLIGVKVLLAEDYDINQMLMASMAERLGLNLIIAQDGQEAVEFVREAAQLDNPFSLILMDIQMPNLDGLAATRVLRAEGFSAIDLPILAVSANAYPEDVEACYAAGMQGHLAKPVSFEQFEQGVREILYSRDMQVSNS